uniref:Uncharacterized protein n=1 Tax=Anopheles minimus TaxID=112268 RepID=A0A182WN44_9DIPT
MTIPVPVVQPNKEMKCLPIPMVAVAIGNG